MPCNSDYLDPTQKEIELAKVYGLLDELETGKLSNKYPDGFDERVYNENISKEAMDEKVEKLCSKLQKTDVSKYSLEMQMWWRNHQEADRKRLEKEIKDKKNKEERDKILSKLSKYEIDLLNLK